MGFYSEISVEDIKQIIDNAQRNAINRFSCQELSLELKQFNEELRHWEDHLGVLSEIRFENDELDDLELVIDRINLFIEEYQCLSSGCIYLIDNRANMDFDTICAQTISVCELLVEYYVDILESLQTFADVCNDSNSMIYRDIKCQLAFFEHVANTVGNIFISDTSGIIDESTDLRYLDTDSRKRALILFNEKYGIDLTNLDLFDQNNSISQLRGFLQDVLFLKRRK